MKLKEAILSREGDSFPGATYAEVVLVPAYDNAKTVLLHPMLAIHKAHLIMMVEQSLLKRHEAQLIMKAIQTLDIPKLQETTYDGRFEDLFFLVESKIMQTAGEIGGSLHLARSRNDMGVAMYRMTLRQKLLDTIQSACAFLQALVDTASQHVDTIMLGYTHTQQAQPMTFAHYLTAVFDSVARDIKRLQAAYSTCNHSPLGAAALTTSGFPINRERVAQLLGFNDLVENSYDAIGGADYLGETAAALQVLFIGIGRFVQDLLLWSTQEFGAIRVADPYVQISSIMPQKRNPVSLEHIRSLSSSGVGRCTTVIQMLHNTPVWRHRGHRGRPAASSLARSPPIGSDPAPLCCSCRDGGCEQGVIAEPRQTQLCYHHRARRHIGSRSQHSIPKFSFDCQPRGEDCDGKATGWFTSYERLD